MADRGQSIQRADTAGTSRGRGGGRGRDGRRHGHGGREGWHDGRSRGRGSALALIPEAPPPVQDLDDFMNFLNGDPPPDPRPRPRPLALMPASHGGASHDSRSHLSRRSRRDGDEHWEGSKYGSACDILRLEDDKSRAHDEDWDGSKYGSARGMRLEDDKSRAHDETWDGSKYGSARGHMRLEDDRSRGRDTSSRHSSRSAGRVDVPPIAAAEPWDGAPPWPASTGASAAASRARQDNFSVREAPKRHGRDPTMYIPGRDNFTAQGTPKRGGRDPTMYIPGQDEVSDPPDAESSLLMIEDGGIDDSLLKPKEPTMYVDGYCDISAAPMSEVSIDPPESLGPSQKYPASTSWSGSSIYPERSYKDKSKHVARNPTHHFDGGASRSSKRGAGHRSERGTSAAGRSTERSAASYAQEASVSSRDAARSRGGSRGEAAARAARDPARRRDQRSGGTEASHLSDRSEGGATFHTQGPGEPLPDGGIDNSLLKPKEPTMYVDGYCDISAAPMSEVSIDPPESLGPSQKYPASTSWSGSSIYPERSYKDKSKHVARNPTHHFDGGASRSSKRGAGHRSERGTSAAGRSTERSAASYAQEASVSSRDAARSRGGSRGEAAARAARDPARRRDQRSGGTEASHLSDRSEGGATFHTQGPGEPLPGGVQFGELEAFRFSERNDEDDFEERSFGTMDDSRGSRSQDISYDDLEESYRSRESGKSKRRSTRSGASRSRASSRVSC